MGAGKLQCDFAVISQTPCSQRLVINSSTIMQSRARSRVEFKFERVERVEAIASRAVGPPHGYASGLP
jgi:hypothetical protein